MAKKNMLTSSLSDVCYLVTDGTHDTPKTLKSGVPFIKAKEIVAGIIDFENCEYISYEDHLKVIARSNPRKADILFAHIGASLGEAAFITTDKEFSIKNVALFKPNPSKINNRYLFYYVISPRFQNEIKNCRTGSAQPFVSLEFLRNHQIEYHADLKTQRKIASILSVYDDLIENNTRRIKILEEMAQAIYREWFVNFRFPGHEKVKMVEIPVETCHGMSLQQNRIPDGWEVRRLGEVLKSIESGRRPKGGVGEIKEGVPSIGAENIIGLGKYDYSKEKYVSVDFFSQMKSGIVKHKDVLLYKDGAQIGRKTMFRDGFPHDNCCINEHVFILRMREEVYQNYLYFWLDQDWMTEKIKNLNANAAQPGINQEGVKSLPILIPPYELGSKFDNLIEPLLDQLFTVAKKQQILQRTRDLILPKLISGEIDVEELDIVTGGVIE
ncbi:MAG: restriction endonuclease subunit S [Deltaproteobacteria bacterium]|nr:restriction endonuclease subunit S [Deltaproteobacteria bacterium]